MTSVYLSGWPPSREYVSRRVRSLCLKLYRFPLLDRTKPSTAAPVWVASRVEPSRDWPFQKLSAPTVTSNTPAPSPAGRVANTFLAPSALVNVPWTWNGSSRPSILAFPLADVKLNVSLPALPSNHSATPPGSPSDTKTRMLGGSSPLRVKWIPMRVVVKATPPTYTPAWERLLSRSSIVSSPLSSLEQADGARSMTIAIAIPSRPHFMTPPFVTTAW